MSEQTFKVSYGIPRDAAFSAPGAPRIFRVSILPRRPFNTPPAGGQGYLMPGYEADVRADCPETAVKRVASEVARFAESKGHHDFIMHVMGCSETADESRLDELREAE